MGKVTSDGRKGNGKWVDRWRENGHARQRTFDRKGDRDEFRTWRRRQQQVGLVVSDLLEPSPLLGEFMEDAYWPLYAIPNLDIATRKRYLQQWGKWILPNLGQYRLKQLAPKVINRRLVDTMRRSGASDQTVLSVLSVLQSILTYAVTEEKIEINPVSQIRKPRQAAPKRIAPISPSQVEQIRARISDVDAALVSLLAYEGLRPEEALALHIEDLLEQSIAIHRKNVDGMVVLDTKTHVDRNPPWTSPLVRKDLLEHVVATGVRGGRCTCTRAPRSACPGLLFRRRLDGRPWSKSDWDNWRSRVWQPAAAAVGLGEYVQERNRAGELVRVYRGAVPYDMRGAAVSLWAWEGFNMVEVSRFAGHSVATCEKHYMGIFEGVDPAKRTTAHEAIRAAREPGVRGVQSLFEAWRQ